MKIEEAIKILKPRFEQKTTNQPQHYHGFDLKFKHYLANDYEEAYKMAFEALEKQSNRINVRKLYRKAMQKLIGEWCRSSQAIELYEVMDYLPGSKEEQYWKGYQNGLQEAIDKTKKELETLRVTEAAE